MMQAFLLEVPDLRPTLAALTLAASLVLAVPALAHETPGRPHLHGEAGVMQLTPAAEAAAPRASSPLAPLLALAAALGLFLLRRPPGLRTLRAR